MARCGWSEGRDTLSDVSPRALVRRPGPRLAEGLVTHIQRRPVDAALAVRQWETYVATLAGHGWETIEVAAANDCPDSVFVEDTVLVLAGRAAVLTRPGATSRRAEVVAVEAAVRGLGLELHRIEAPGTLDGGDVLKIGETLYVGRGGRTDDDGIRQLGAIGAEYGMRVVPVDVSRVLHLKSAVPALPDGTVVGYPPLVDDPSVFRDFLPVA